MCARTRRTLCAVEATENRINLILFLFNTHGIISFSFSFSFSGWWRWFCHYFHSGNIYRTAQRSFFFIIRLQILSVIIIIVKNYGKLNLHSLFTLRSCRLLLKNEILVSFVHIFFPCLAFVSLSLLHLFILFVSLMDGSNVRLTCRT